MRSGNWTLHTGVCLTLLTSAIVGFVSPCVVAQQASTDFSRRLPYRPRGPITAEAVTAASATIGAASGGMLAPATRIRSAADPMTKVTPAAYLTSDEPPVEESVVPVPMTESVMDGQPLESLWEPADGPPYEMDGVACCDVHPQTESFLALDHLSFFGGVQASKNNSTRGQDASFGFHEGLNFGTAARNVVLPPSVGLQIGFQANQANLEGASFTPDDRKQYFLTAGAFRRSDYGLQGGLVFDYLWDKWNYDLEAAQLRGELSFALTNRNSFGFWFASSLTDNNVASVVSGQTVAESWNTVDYYAMFYRTSLFAGGRGEGQLMAGMTQDSDGIIGGKSRMPLINGWALETEFTYLVPNEPRGGGANAHESWNLGINFVWYPGTLHCGECFRYHRPMFDVANNGSMILRRQP